MPFLFATTSRPALGSIQSPVQRVPWACVANGWALTLNTKLHLVSRSEMYGVHLHFPLTFYGVVLKVNGKGKVVPLTRHGGALCERRLSSYAFLTSALEGSEWVLKNRDNFMCRPILFAVVWSNGTMQTDSDLISFNISRTQFCDTPRAYASVTETDNKIELKTILIHTYRRIKFKIIA
jgi:hypothetical protein